MKKSIAGVVLSAVMIFSLTGCGENGTESAESALTTEALENTLSDTATEPDMTTASDKVTEENLPPKEEEHKIDISEIDWNVSASVVNGKRITALNYTNNSSYPIIDFKIKFTQKPDLTDEQLAILNIYKEELNFDDDEIRDIYLTGESKKYAETGQTVSDTRCYINGFWGFEGSDILEVIRPDMATIEYIDTDGKGYTMYYDFLNESYGKSSDNGEVLQNWSDSELASMIQKPNAYKIDITSDRDDWFYFEAYGITPDTYKEYIKALKSMGFEDELGFFDSTSFFGSKDDIRIDILYSTDNETMDVTVSR